MVSLELGRILKRRKDDKKDREQDPNEFIRRFVAHASDCLQGAYRLRQIRTDTTCGSLRTSLPTDICSLLHHLTDALEDFICDDCGLERTERGHKIRVQALWGTLQALKRVQQANILLFWTSMESCSAAANDFLFLSDEALPQWSEALLARHPYLRQRAHGGSQTFALLETCQELIRSFSRDAVHAAQRSVVFILRALNNTQHDHQQQLGNSARLLFSRQWERDFTHNELVQDILNIIVNDYLSLAREYLQSDYLYEKLLSATAQASVCFYLKQWIERADKVRTSSHSLLPSQLGRRRKRFQMSRNGGIFESPERALRRMEDDIRLMRDSFRALAENARTPGLTRIVAQPFHILDLVHECLLSGIDDDDQDDNGTCNVENNGSHKKKKQKKSNNLETFVVVIHKHTGADLLVTQCLVRDLWLLVYGNGQATRKSKRRILQRLQHSSEQYSNNSHHRQEQQHEPLSGLVNWKVLKADLTMVSRGVQELSLSSSSSPTANTTISSSLFASQQFLSSDLLLCTHLETMLRSMYEDRLVQNMLPVCWTCCLVPAAAATAKKNNQFDDEDNDDIDENDQPVFIVSPARVRALSRSIARIHQDGGVIRRCFQGSLDDCVL